MNQEQLDSRAEALRKFLVEWQELGEVTLWGVSCCGCGDITLEIMPTADAGSGEWISADVMKI